MKIIKIIFAFFIVFTFKSYAFENQGSGVTSLMQATANNDIDGAKFFAKMNYSEINNKNIGGATALHIAARSNYSEIVKILLDVGADVDVVDNEKYTPLMRAVSFGNKESAALIFQKNPTLAMFNKQGESIIILSAISSCTECLQMTFDRIIPHQNFRPEVLKSQLKRAFVIASWKENEVQKKMLMDFMNKLSDKSTNFVNKNNPKRVYILNEKEPASKKNFEFVEQKRATKIENVTIRKKSKSKKYKLKKANNTKKKVYIISDSI
jgi:ankyrin repeat protein